MADNGEGFASAEDELRMTKRKLEELSISHYKETASLKKEVDKLQQRLRETKLKADSKESLYQELEKRNMEYQSDYEGKKEVVSSLENENRKLKNKVIELDLILSEQNDDEKVCWEEFEKSQEELKASQNRVIDLENVSRNLSDKVFQLESDKEALADATSDLKEHLELKNQTIEGFKKDLEGSSQEIAKLSDSLREKRKELTELRGKLSEMDAQNRELTIELTELRHSNNFLKKDLETSRTEKTSALQRLHEVEESVRSSEGSVRYELDMLAKTENRMRQRCIEMEIMISESMKEKDELKLKNAALDSRVKALEMRLVEVQDEKTDVEFQVNGICGILRKKLQIYVKDPLSSFQKEATIKKGTGDDDEDSNFDQEEIDGLPFDPDELSAALASWQTELVTVKAKKEELSSSLDLLQKKFKDTLGETMSLKKNVEEEKDKLAACEKTKARIEQQFERTEETLRLQEEEISRKDIEIGKLLDENSRLQKLLSLSEMNLKDVKNRAAEMDSKSEIATRDRLSIQRELGHLEAKCTKLEKSKRKTETELKKQQAMASDTVHENETLRAHLKTLIEDNRSLAEKAFSFEKMHATSMRENAETSKNTEEQIREITRLRKELKSFDKLMRQKDSSLREINEILNDLRGKLGERESDLKALRVRCAALEEEVEKFRQAETLLSDQAKTSRESFASTQRQLRDVEGELAQSTRTIKDQGKTVDQLLSKITTLQDEKERQKQEIEILERSVRDKEEKVKKLKDSGKKGVGEKELLESELNRKQREIEKLQGALINITEEKMFLDQSMRQLEDEKEMMRSQLHSLNVKMADMATQIERKYAQETQKNVYDLRLENQSLKTRIEDLEEERKFAEKSQTQRISSLEAQISSLRLELKKEIYERQELENSYAKKDDEFGRFRTTFDKSLHTINRDANNLKVILDKSLHKLDKQILVGQGLASDTDATTDADDPVRDSPRSFVTRKMSERLSRSLDSKRRHYFSHSSQSDDDEDSQKNVRNKKDSEPQGKHLTSRHSFSPPKEYKSSSRYRNGSKGYVS